MDSWDFLAEKERIKLSRVYHNRLNRLEQAGSSEISHWPESDWDPGALPEPEAGTTRLKEQTSPPVPQEPQPARTLEPEPTPLPPQPATPGYLDRLVGEADIRWFHSLGALLVIAAMVGWLRASWDSYGRTLTGLLIASSPFLLHLAASKLKKSVPLSSRLLSILANLVTPPALLALDVFGALPPSVPGDHYWTFSMLISATILSWQAQQTREKVPLYTGALCAVMAGWSQGALATSILSLSLGFLFARDTTGGDDHTWSRHRRQVSFFGGGFGAAASLVLFETANNPFLPMIAFTAALIFLHLPNLAGDETSSTRLFLQTGFTIVGSLLMRSVLEVSAPGVALYLVFASALYLTVKPDSQFAALSARLSGALGFVGLAIGFLGNFKQVIEGNQTSLEASLRFLFALIGAAYFLMASRKFRHGSKTLVVAALFSVLGGWCHLFLHFGLPHGLEHLLDLFWLSASLILLQTLLVAGTRLLYSHERDTTWTFTLGLTFLGCMICGVAGLATAEPMNRWPLALALHGVFCLLWERGVLAPYQPHSPIDSQIRTILPRLTVFCLAGAFVLAEFVAPRTGLISTLVLLQTLAFWLRGSYKKASWEGAWATTLLSLGAYQNLTPHLLITLGSLVLAVSARERKPLSLFLSVPLGLWWMTEYESTTPVGLLYILPASFLLAALLPRPNLNALSSLGKSRFGFDVLLVGAVLLTRISAAGSTLSIVYCLTVLAIALLLHQILSPTTAALTVGSLFLWSLQQTTLETGLVMLFSGLAVGWLGKRAWRWEVVNGLGLLALAQIATTTHFHFEPLVLCGGVLLSELATFTTGRLSQYRSNLTLLAFVFLVRPESHWVHALPELFVCASLLLAIRSVQQKRLPTAAASTLLFLIELDSVLPHRDLDIKLRLLPTALVLIAAGLWKFREQRNWALPCLRVGLAFTVAPALLQFAGGSQMWTNFLWTLLAGGLYIALSFLFKEELTAVFRQAGGFTLVGWAIVSLTRAALELPWQAGTLVVGLALVGAGIYVEKTRTR